MSEKRRKTSVDLTELAQVVKNQYVHLGLKNILSAGLLLFAEETGDGKLKAIAKANGATTDDPAETAATAARFCIKIYEGLNTKDFAVSLQFLSDKESRAIKQMLTALAPPRPKKPPRKRRVGVMSRGQPG